MKNINEAKDKDEYIAFLEMIIKKIWMEDTDSEEVTAEEYRAGLRRAFEEYRETAQCPKI